MHAWLEKTLDWLHPAKSATKLVRSPAAQTAAQTIADELCLYHFDSCPYCLRTRQAIHRLNVDIALRDIHRDSTARAELIQGGGRPTVPCLRIGSGEHASWLYESNDIIRYLERRLSAQELTA